MVIKVCGLRDADNIKAITALVPDYMGFICYDKSSRFIADMPVTVLKALPETIYKIAVFVNESREQVESLIAQYGFNAVQLHGDESPEFAKALRNKVKVLKAFGVDDNFDFDMLTAYADSVDYFLFDTKTTGYGGSGKVFNWALLDNYKLIVPFFLSGGISLDNLEQIKQIEHPQFYGVDLNSRFELEPALKDVDKLKKAFEILRR